MLYAFLLIVHIIISALLVVTILMQASKGGGLAGIAGGMAATQQVFGGRQTATLLHKVTIALALVFGINALLLGGLSRNQSTPRSATLEAISQDEEFPLDFLGTSPIAPTEGQLEQQRRNTPPPVEEPAEQPVEQPVEQP